MRAGLVKVHADSSWRVGLDVRWSFGRDRGCMGPSAPTTQLIGPVGAAVTVHSLGLTAPPSTITEVNHNLARQIASVVT